MTVPSYSLIIETANLSLADLDGLRTTLDSLAVQTLPVQNAREVLLADSGDVPPESLQQTLRIYPWVRPMGLAEGTGYEELKMAGANASSGELIVFADGDCLYERTWLEALLAPFSDPSVSIVGGETAINSAGPYGLAVAIASSFPARARSDSPYRSDRYPPEQRRLPPPGSAGCTDSLAPTVLPHEWAACCAAAGQGLHDPASALRPYGACRAKRSLALRVALPAHGIRRCGRAALDRKGVDARRQVPGSAPSNVPVNPILGSAGHSESRGRASRQTVAFTGAAPRAARLCVRSCAAGDRRARRAHCAAAVPGRGAGRNPPGEHVRTPAGAPRGPFASSEGRLESLDSRPKPWASTGRRSSRDTRTMRRAAKAAMDLQARRWPSRWSLPAARPRRGAAARSRAQRSTSGSIVTSQSGTSQMNHRGPAAMPP